jgi:hypothetical protein
MSFPRWTSQHNKNVYIYINSAGFDCILNKEIHLFPMQAETVKRCEHGPMVLKLRTGMGGFKEPWTNGIILFQGSWFLISPASQHRTSGVAALLEFSFTSCWVGAYSACLVIPVIRVNKSLRTDRSTNFDFKKKQINHKPVYAPKIPPRDNNHVFYNMIHRF